MTHKEILIRNQVDSALENWRKKEKKAQKLLKIVGELRFDKTIELVMFRQDVYDARPSEVLNFLTIAKNYIDQSIDIQTSLQIAKAIADIDDLPASKIDIGKLAVEWLQEESNFSSVKDFIHNKLSHFIGQEPKNQEHKDVVLYGFGRIGRLAARRILSTTGSGEQLRLKAIVIRPKLKDLYQEATKRAALLADDSVHGAFHGVVEVSEDGSYMIINGNAIRLIYANNPTEVDYEAYGIKDALLIDNTGVWRDKESLSQHLRPGISKVMLTAPAKGVPNIVHGVNQHILVEEEHSIFCAASCTTNAIVPILKVIDDHYTVGKGHIETIHAYTSDQNLLDNFHKKPRRGRGAAINMVLTSTGAAKAVAKALPHLEGKLTGNSVRVPTPNVSLAILNLGVEKTTSVEEVNEALKNASLYGDLVEQLLYSTSTEYVSSHATGMTSTSVLDAPSTIVSKDGKTLTLYAWYDNEYGYTCQVIRLAKFASKVRRFCYY